MRVVFKGWGILIGLEYRLGRLWLSGPYRMVVMVAFKLLAFSPLLFWLWSFLHALYVPLLFLFLVGINHYRG